MLVRHSVASKIRNVKLRAFLRYNVWARAPQLRSVALVDCPQAGVDRQLEGEDR